MIRIRSPQPAFAIPSQISMATSTKKPATRPLKRKHGKGEDSKRYDVTLPSPKKNKEANPNSKKRQRLAQETKPAVESGDALDDVLTTPKRIRNVSVSTPKARGDRLKPLAEGAQLKEQAEWLWTAFLTQAGAKLSPLERIPFTESNLLALPHADVSDDVIKADPMSALAEHLKLEYAPQWRAGAGAGAGGTGGGADGAGDGEAAVGCPTVLVACASAKRCIEVLRLLRAAGPGVRTVKLFAKHMKVEEQVELLRHPVHLAIGTPSRMNQLAKSGALGMGNLGLTVLDMKKSQKGLTLLDIPELRVDFWDFFRAQLYNLVQTKQSQICLVL